MKILVDADACPKSVLEISKRVAQRYDVPLWTVASFNHTILSDHHILVGDDPQETDIKILNLTEPEDIVITQDWGLAAIVLGKGARCLSPIGREYRPERVEFLLEERELKARHRRSGGRTKGPKKRTAEDDRRFEVSLEQMLARVPLSMGPGK
jgi:uncharacterized protein